MRKIWLVLLFFSAVPAGASHIVGGEFELLHISGNTYRLNLIIYFDKINGLPGAKDPSATVSIFRSIDDSFISNVVLTLNSESLVDYTQPECSQGELITDKLIYTTVITLSPTIFNEPEGYYVAWERCCRNYNITNIFSEDINTQPGGIAAGQTFLLEFPPVVKNGQPFINSSPRLFPPLNDFACPNRPYYVDFAGIDDDGDSLVYTMVTPLNTHSPVALPPVLPKPYPLVIWRDGFGINNIIKGNPDLKISTDGLLTTTPVVQGLFVFAVRIDEYRNKELIGVSRRDFQMLVLDGCGDAVPPEISGPAFVALAATDTGSDRCITVTVSDDDSLRPEDGFQENIRIRAIGLNFLNKNLTEILPDDVTATLQNGSVKDFTICFPVCPFFVGGPYQVGIIAMDDACSLPLLDTLRVTVDAQPPPNQDPRFIQPDPLVQPNPINIVLNEGESTPQLPFLVTDGDGDELLVSVLTDGFVLQEAGIRFMIDDQAPGFAQGYLQWDAFCDIYDFTQRTTFQVRIRVDDLDICNLNEPVEAVYNFTVILPGNASPIIDTNLTADPEERIVSGIQRAVFQNLSFTVTGKDVVDNDFLVLEFLGDGVLSADSLKSLGMTFDNVEGNAVVQSQFNWDISCAKLDLAQRDIFDLRFVVVDSKNKCRIVKADTVEVEIKILPPSNQRPLLVVNSLDTEVPLLSNQLSVTLGTQIVLGVQGSDMDSSPQDFLRLELIGAEGNVPPMGFVFESAEGVGSVATTFSWNPDCNIFENGVFENNYTFTFRLHDDRCFNTKADTVAIDIKIRDVEGNEEGFIPVNFFSPNDDQVNDYYAMESLNKETGEVENILPPDNCSGQFQTIRIYNRWGKRVFESTDRNFRWFGKDQAAGVYYYTIQFSNREYKGALSIRY